MPILERRRTRIADGRLEFSTRHRRSAATPLPEAGRHLGSQRPRPSSSGRMRSADRIVQSGDSTMSTVHLVDESMASPRVRAVFEDIKETKKIDRVPNIWRALATHPEHLELCWTRLK